MDNTKTDDFLNELDKCRKRAEKIDNLIENELNKIKSSNEDILNEIKTKIVKILNDNTFYSLKDINVDIDLFYFAPIIYENNDESKKIIKTLKGINKNNIKLFSSNNNDVFSIIEENINKDEYDNCYFNFFLDVQITCCIDNNDDIFNILNKVEFKQGFSLTKEVYFNDKALKEKVLFDLLKDIFMFEKIIENDNYIFKLYNSQMNLFDINKNEFVCQNTCYGDCLTNDFLDYLQELNKDFADYFYNH